MNSIALIFIGIVIFIIGLSIGASWMFRNQYPEIKKEYQRAQKFEKLFIMMNRWLDNMELEVNISSYLQELNYRQIAVYGIGRLGNHLLRQLKNTDIKVVYGIDIRGEKASKEIPIITPEQELKEVDAIIVTTPDVFDKIADMLESRVDCPILSLEDIVYALEP